MVLAAVLVLNETDPSLFTKMVLAAPGALFPLMALFLWLDTERYKEYLPLFAAGKGIGIFTLLGWFIVSQKVTMIGCFHGIAIIAELLLLSGDLFALAAVFLIIKDVRNLDTAVPDMEDK
jgi:hypothetical protein